MKFIWYIIGKYNSIFRKPLVCGTYFENDPKPFIKKPIVNTCSLYYECPLAWVELEGKDKIRHCNECNKDVFWCDNEADFERHVAKKNCVAFLLSNNPEPLVGIPAEPEETNTEKSHTNTWAIIILGIMGLKIVKGILTSYYG